MMRHDAEAKAGGARKTVARRSKLSPRYGASRTILSRYSLSRTSLIRRAFGGELDRPLWDSHRTGRRSQSHLLSLNSLTLDGSCPGCSLQSLGTSYGNNFHLLPLVLSTGHRRRRRKRCLPESLPKPTWISSSQYVS